MKLNKILKNKEKIYILLCFVLGATLFISGTFMYFMTPKSTKTTVQQRETEDSFKLYFTEQITADYSDHITLNVNIEDINILSGDKGIGVLLFELEYDKNLFNDPSVTALAPLSIKTNTIYDQYMIMVNDGNIIKNDMSLLTLKFTKKANFTADETTIKLKNIKGSSGKTVSAPDVSTKITFSDNYEEVLDDEAYPEINFSRDGNLNPDGSSSCEKSVSTVVTVTDAEDNLIDSSLKYIWTTTPSSPESTSWRKFNSGDTISKSTVSGTYYLCIAAKDKADHESVKCSRAFQIDGEKPPKPVITGTGLNDNEYSGNVEITISGGTSCSGVREYQYSLNNGESWLSYDSNNKPIISTEGVTSVIAKSINNFGVESLNSDPYVVTVTRPNMELNYSTSTLSPTNQNVTVEISSSTKLTGIEGWFLSSDQYSISKIYETNKTEKIEVEDIYGNIIPLTIIVNQIDKKSPTLSVANKHSSDYEEITITSDEDLKPITGWLLSRDKRSLKKVYYNNTSEEVVVSDLANNQVTIPINIQNISSKFDVDVQYEKTSNNKLKVTISSQNNTLEPITGWTISADNKSLTKEFDHEVTDTIKVTSSGITKSVKLLYELPDDDVNLTLSYSKEEQTNENILVSIIGDKELKPIEGWILSGDKLSLTKIYSDNIKESITVTTIDNETKKLDINIGNIDKVLPEILNVTDNGVYPEIKLEFNKIIDMINITKDGQEISSPEDIEVLNEEGNYEISLYDEVGNNNHYNLRVAEDQVVNVENTSKSTNIILILLGLFELIVGILIVRGFKVNKKANIAVLLFAITILGFNNSYAAEKTAFELNGYTVKNNNLYGVEATTTVNNMKDNFDNSSKLNITRDTGYMSTGDVIGYDGHDYTIVVSGDVHSDGRLDNTDVDDIAKLITNWGGYISSTNRLAADYNQDNVIDISDLYDVNKRVVKNDYVIKAKNVKISNPSDVRIGHSVDIEYKIYPSNSNESINYSIVSGKNTSSVKRKDNILTINGLKKGTSKIRFQVGNAYMEKEYEVKESHKLHFIYTSGADCMILESNGEYGMIDTCFESTKSRINKKMKELGATNLKFLILTHNHKDHVGGALNVIDKYVTDTTTVYIKRYSYYGNYSKRDELEEQYQKIIAAARNKTNDTNKTKVKEIGETDAHNKCITGKCTNSFDISDRNISLGKFNIKLYNLDEAVSRSNRKDASENLNTLTQLLSITINGKTTYTYLEGDMSYFSNKSKTEPKYLDGISVKEATLKEVLDDVGKKKVDVFKAAHHGYYNGISYNEVKALKPKYIIATSRESSIKETKDNEMKAAEKAIENNEKPPTDGYYGTAERRYCAAKIARQYFEESERNTFESGFISFDSNETKNIEVDYSTGDVKVTGGASWTDTQNISKNCTDTKSQKNKKIKVYLCTRGCSGIEGERADIMSKDFINKYAK